MNAPNRFTRRDALYLGALLLVAALYFWPAWLQPDSFWYPPDAEFCDITYTHWPKMWYVQQTWREHGQIPLWMTLVIGGTPFVGNPLAAYFYPPNWLFLFLPVTFTFHLIFAVQVFLAGALAYGLLRWSYRRTPFAALVGGLCYMLSPKLLAHIGTGHVGWSQAFAWLPLTLWLLRGAIEKKSILRAAWCGASIALTYFADPRVMFYSVLLHAGYALYRLISLWRTEGFKAMFSVALRLTALPIAFVLIGAAQMLPTAELMSMSTRAELTLEQAGVYSLPWRYLIGFLLADRGGFHEWMTYLGLLPLLLAVLALLRRSTEDRWFWLGATVAIFLYGSGVNGPLYPLLFRLLPSLGWVRVPSRVLLLLPLAACALAGQGVDALLGPWAERAQRRTTLIAFGGALICLGAGVGLALIAGPTLSSSALVLATIGTAAMALLMAVARGWLPRRALETAVVALILIDLWSTGRSMMTLRSFDEIMGERADVVAYLSAQDGRAQGDRFRVYSPSYSIPHQVGARYEIEQLDGVEPSHTWWLAEFMALAGGYELDGYAVTIPAFPTDSDVRTALRDAQPSAALLGLMNGLYIAADFPIDAPGWTLEAEFAPVYLYRNAQAMPRAWTTARAETAADWPEAQARLAAGFDPARAALVESERPLDGPPGYRAAEVVYFSPNRIVVETQVDAPSLLVLAEVWYPGWTATVDGVQQPIYRVDGLMRGVYLDAGAQRVELIYSPASLWIGLALSVAALLGLIAASVIKRAR